MKWPETEEETHCVGSLPGHNWSCFSVELNNWYVIYRYEECFMITWNPQIYQQQISAVFYSLTSAHLLHNYCQIAILQFQLQLICLSVVCMYACSISAFPSRLIDYLCSNWAATEQQQHLCSIFCPGDGLAMHCEHLNIV